MARYASWLVNAALGVLACFFVAQGANSVLAAILTEVPAGPPAAAAAVDAPAGRAFSDYEVILTRNLFHASTLEPPPVELSSEMADLEETQLPLNLLGTAAVEDHPELSWAAVEDRETQQTLVVSLNDTVRNAAVVRGIENKRIVLEEKGALRELKLPEQTALAAIEPAAARPMARPRIARRAPPQPAPPDLPAVPDEGPRSPARLFSEARILPKYEEGQMVGVQVSAIKPGSLFEKMGVQEGEVITQLNGIRIDSPEQSAKILLELTRSQEFTIQVEGPAGSRSLTAALPEP